ncbi:MAG: archease [Thermoanaerobaculum sp.]|nr:archease [Thermoanaerobaculum sp.]MCX7896034.1 archease [Thermoanaerobaculum sp.]MDW7968378.1 archease [Thermoanaerobaculum sp.]
MGRLRFRQLPHTADVRLIVYGRSEEEILRHLAVGIGRLVLGKTPAGSAPELRTVQLPPGDMPRRLVRVGNEVLFYLFYRHLATVNLQLSGDLVQLHMQPLASQAQPRFEVKAVTFHALKLKVREDGRMAAVVTLDL